MARRLWSHTTSYMVILLGMSLFVLPVFADSGGDVTIVYDVSLREFVCWFKGEPRDANGDPDFNPCNGAYPYYDGIHFYRGETIHLQLYKAHLIDLYALEFQVNDLAIPVETVFGSLAELPKVQLIEPAEMVVPLEGAAVPSSDEPLQLPDDMYDRLDEWDPDPKKQEFSKYLQGALFDYAGTLAKPPKPLSPESPRLIDQLDEKLKIGEYLVREAESLKGAFDALDTESSSPVALERMTIKDFEKKYCPSMPQGQATDQYQATDQDLGPLAEVGVFVDNVRHLEHLFKRQEALRGVIASYGLAEAGKIISEQIKLLDDPVLRRMLEIDETTLGDLLILYDNDFPQPDRRQLINQITLKQVQGKNQYTLDPDPPTDPFLDAINNENSPGVTKTDLEKLKANLLVMADQWNNLNLAVRRISAYRNLATRLDIYRKGECDAEDMNKMRCDQPMKTKREEAKTIFEYQQELNEINALGIRLAYAANCIAQNMPLPSSTQKPLDRIELGRWFANKEIALTVKQGSRVALFNVGGVAQSGRIAVAGGASGQAAAVTTAPQAAAAVRQTRFRIHNRYLFQLSAGYMVSTMKDANYELANRTVVITDTTSRMENFFVRTRNRGYHFLPTIELIIYPKRRDFMPWKARYEGEKKPKFKNLGLLLGFSLADPSQDFLFGVAWLPRQGIGLKAGLHVGFEDELPKGVALIDGQDISAPLTEELTFVREKLDYGIFAGLTLNSQLFKEVFGLILQP